MKPRGPTASAFWPAMETDERGQFLGVNLTISGTKTRAVGYTCKGFFLIGAFEAGRSTLNLGSTSLSLINSFLLWY